MKKPYIKRIGKFSGYNIFYVNGYLIRKNYDPEFTNFGSHRYFKFIPKNEFWIDKENGKIEARYFIDNFLTIERESEKGKSHEEAVEIANSIEKRERDKSKFLKKLRRMKIKEKVLKRVYKKRLFQKYTDKIKIMLVRGDLVRSLFYLDFTEGGHDKVYDFVPKNEIWIDDDVYKKERAIILIHELHERALMLKGWTYDQRGIGIFSRKGKNNNKSAHFEAEGLEIWVRHHPRSTKRVLLKEIKDNDRLSSA